MTEGGEGRRVVGVGKGEKLIGEGLLEGRRGNQGEVK